MSKVIVVNDNEDMPCTDWGAKDCPMKSKWHEGEERICHECGWIIQYENG